MVQSAIPTLNHAQEPSSATVPARDFSRGQVGERRLREAVTVKASESIAGAALVELVRADAADVAPAYLLTGAGLENLP
jgi:hypothetical protein